MSPASRSRNTAGSRPIMSGGVISTLVYAALAVASNAMLGMLPGVACKAIYSKLPND